MKKALALLVFALTLGPCLAGEYQDGMQAYDSKDYASAKALFSAAAATGKAQAQSMLGDIYFDGSGVERDFEKAFTWYKLAAQQSDVHAQLRVGAMYAMGLGVIQNDAMGFKWLMLAAEQGDSRGQWEIGKSFPF